MLMYRFVKSALTTVPALSNQGHVLLQGSDSVSLNPESVASTRLGRNVDKLCDLQWQTVQIPDQYMAINWPLRFCCIDHSGQYLAVAGSRGLIHYNMVTRKWRIFGNQTQELGFKCRGGLLWWNDYIVVACYNFIDKTEEIRFYHRSANLDNRFLAKCRRVSKAVLMMNVFEEFLIVYTANRMAAMFRLSTVNNPNATEKGEDGLSVVMELVRSVDLSEHVPHPLSLVSLCMVRAGTEELEDSHGPGALIVNVSGRLLMFSMDAPTEDQPRPGFSPPVLLSTGVENYWAPFSSSLSERHLRGALWLSCGGAGMKVWLPLYSESPSEPKGYLSKRLMLPFQLNVYPLSVLFEDAVVLGASFDTHKSFKVGQGVLPFYALKRKTQIYLHHIIRQLLRRSLGETAEAIAQACCGLPYFGHVLELMLHEVLEDETSALSLSKDEALLPHVVKFVSKFPAYLKIIVHCARKTEVAKWSYLFSIVGEPTSLFKKCLELRQYDTAASYLIILQSLESPAASRERALFLLDIALEKDAWDLTRDLIRFLKATAEVTSPGKTLQLPPPTEQEVERQLFSQYAQNLMKMSNLRALGKFAAHLSFSLVDWLRSERLASARVSSFSKSLFELHQCFQWPLPRAEDSDQSPDIDAEVILATKEQDSTDITDASPMPLDSVVANSSPRKSSTRPSVIDDDITTQRVDDTFPIAPNTLDEFNTYEKTNRSADELAYFLNVMYEAKCYDWAFLIAVMLQDKHAISQVMGEAAVDTEIPGGIFSLLKKFEAVANAPQGAAYQPFYQEVVAMCRSATPAKTEVERQRQSGSTPATTSECVIS
eukprot:m.59679 g.59679  ORF g.59679 m.59679 type:complete len:824 (-) comp19121_c1_seq1:92-2563(-)